MLGLWLGETKTTMKNKKFLVVMTEDNYTYGFNNEKEGIFFMEKILKAGMVRKDRGVYHAFYSNHSNTPHFARGYYTN